MDYDEKGCTKQRLDDIEARGKQKTGGTATVSNKTNKGKGYFHTDKILIIGQGGSGKTQLAFDLLLYLVGPFRNVIYMNNQFDDKIVRNFKCWCKKAGLGFFEVDTSSKGLEIPDVDHCCYIIDDTYSSKHKNIPVETLISKLWNRGRHDGNHVIYIAHLDKYLNLEAANNATQTWVDRPFKKYPCSMIIPEYGKKWYVMTNPLDEKTGKIYEPEISIPHHPQQIIQRLSRKSNTLPPEKKKEAPEKEIYQAIHKAGNVKATKKEFEKNIVSSNAFAAHGGASSKISKKSKKFSIVTGGGRDHNTFDGSEFV